MTSLRSGFLALAVIALPAGQVASDNRPESLQARGIARLDQFRNELHRNGVQASQLNQLDTAATELALSYRQFAAASNLAQAALSLTKLADAERYASQIANMAPALMQSRGQSADVLIRRSRDHCKQAADLARKSGANAFLVKALKSGAIAEIDLHDYGSANSLAGEAMRVAASCPDAQACRRDALDVKVSVEAARGELFSAISHVNGLLALLKPVSDPEMQFTAYFSRGDIYRSWADGCSSTHEKSAEVCDRLFDLSKADAIKARDTATRAGFAYFARLAQEEVGQLDTLRMLTDKLNPRDDVSSLFHPRVPKDVTVSDVVPTGQSPGTIQALKDLIASSGPSMPDAITTHVAAQMAELEGHDDAALEGYLRAIQMVDDDRAKLSEESARSAFLEDKVNFYQPPILMLLRKKRYAEAFDLMESTRSRATAELVSTRSLRLSNPVDRRTFATLAVKQSEVAQLQKQFFGDIFAPDPTGDDPDAIAGEQARLTQLEDEYEQLLRRVAGATSPARNGPAKSTRASLQAVQDMLRQDSADMLYYYLIDTAVIVVHISPDAFEVRQVFLPRSLLKSKVSTLLNSMSKQDVTFRDDLSRELFLFLLQPVVQGLRTDRLIIVPQNELVSLPFQALQDPANNTFAGERFRISYGPSASILMQLKKQGSLGAATLFAAADPSLPGAAQEVGTIGHLYSSRQKVVSDSLITKSALMQSAGSYDILHLAVHGEFDAQEPLLSSVKLAPGPGTDGAFTAAEMFALPLDNTRLVTLSACESGRVATTRANEIPGIQQALLFAGAQSLLVSAWKVDSRPTSLWMQTFYREAQGKAPPDAAREAIRALRRNPAYSHPHYWAPFLLIAR